MQSHSIMYKACSKGLFISFFQFVSPFFWLSLFAQEEKA
jgi:hypothetical protein